MMHYSLVGSFECFFSYSKGLQKYLIMELARVF
jgi:hypothetical protein